MKTKEMMQTHPQKTSDVSGLVQCIEKCFECAQACTSCADACLHEKQKLPQLVDCIHKNLDCADICIATGNVLTRMASAPNEMGKSMLQACLTACRICGEECQKHASMMEHCRVCAQVCQECAQACEAVAR